LLGASVSQLLGCVYLTRFWTAALRRREGRLLGLLVDETHTFSRGPLPDVLAEGRGFGLAAVIANHYLDQFPARIRSAILGNVGSVIAFRLGEQDAQTLGARFAPEFETPAPRRAPNFVAACSLLVGGAPAPAFSLVVNHVVRRERRAVRIGDAARYNACREPFAPFLGSGLLARFEVIFQIDEEALGLGDHL
jgi:hypothetical protein